MGDAIRNFLIQRCSLGHPVLRPARETTRHRAHANNWNLRLQGCVSQEEQRLRMACLPLPPGDERLLLWLQFCSWGQCPTCCTWHKRSLSQAELRRPERALCNLLKQCWRCASGHDRSHIPQVDDVPAAFHGLPEEANRILSPFVLHQGNPKKHAFGYIRKDAMTSLSWKPQSVDQDIETYVGKDSYDALKRARTWLLEHSVAYVAYDQAHDQHLTLQTSRWLLPSAILEPYLESAVFPVFYWSWHLCESKHWDKDWCVPFQNQRKQSSDRSSVKAAFVEKLLCSVSDYTISFKHYPLLQFQFDRYMVSLVTQRAGRKGKADLSKHFDEQHWSPAYWNKHHRALMDICEQLGEPQLFITIAPYEWSFPWPYWVERARTAACVGPSELSGAEVLSVAHALHQVCAGFLCGKTDDSSKWKDHIFSNKVDGSSGVTTYFARYEYQDGGKEHEFGKGRGSLHVHMLIWLDGAPQIHPEWQVCAEFPEDPYLCGLSKLVNRGEKSWAPLEHRPSWWSWDGARWLLHLRHTEEFYEASLRPYIKSLLRVLKCQMDVQWWGSSNILLRYVVGYATKFDEGWDKDWLDDAPDSLSAVLHMLRCWHPSECQMVMILARDAMAFTNVDSVHYRMPGFGMEMPAWLVLYRARDPTLESLCLLQWLRQHTLTQVNGSLTAKPRERKTIVAVDAECWRFPKDQFFYQWLLLRLPHRSFRDLIAADACLVSPRHYQFANALLLRPECWASDSWCQTFLEQQGHRAEYAADLLRTLQALRHQCRGQIAGTLPQFAYGPLASAGSGGAMNAEQSTWYGLMTEVMERNRNTSEAGTWFQKPYFLTGGPGTGKTYVLKLLLASLAQDGETILVASPTGKLALAVQCAEGMRSTTVHKAFGLSLDGDRWDPWYAASWSVWVICEVSMVSTWLLLRILHNWKACDQMPLLIFEGDFHQLPPPEAEEDIRTRIEWQVQRYELRQQMRCNDADFIRWLAYIRIATPTQQEVQDFCMPLSLGDLTENTLVAAWTKFPTAPVLTATRATTAWVNNVGLHHFGGEWLRRVPIWTDDGIEQQWLRSGTMIMVARNKDVQHLCNGHVGRVIQISAAGVSVDFGTFIETVHLRTDWSGVWKGSALDITLAYASTVHKVEGCTLDSGIVCFENWACDGWGYTALSRFRQRNNMLFLGQPEWWHFKPRRIL